MGVAGLLLTGGRSTRLGTDKAALVIDGVPLAHRVAGALSAVVAPVVEVGPGRSPLRPVCEDPPGQGPLAALAAGAAELRRLGHVGPAVVLATDLPFVTARLVQILASHPGAACVVPVVDGRRQVLAARYSPAALGLASELVGRGRRSMTALIEAVEVVELPECDLARLVDLRELADVDTVDDLSRLGLEPG